MRDQTRVLGNFLHLNSNYKQNPMFELRIVVLIVQEAATKIQSAFLGFMQRKLFKNQRKAALKVQRVWRKFVTRKIEERKALLKQQVEEVHNEFQKHEVRLKE